MWSLSRCFKPWNEAIGWHLDMLEAQMVLRRDAKILKPLEVTGHEMLNLVATYTIATIPSR